MALFFTSDLAVGVENTVGVSCEQEQPSDDSCVNSLGYKPYISVLSSTLYAT
jgi:hypothetical protein